MIPDPESLGSPSEETVSALLRWRPEHGVISIYARIDPGDRGEAWRTELRSGLAEVARRGQEEDQDRADRLAIAGTTERLEHDLLDEAPAGEPSGLIGFVEVSRDEGEERWYGVQAMPSRTQVLHGPIAHVHPLIELLDDGAPRGIAAVSSERVRLIDWRLGRSEQLHDWELEYFGEDWRERKAEKPHDPARQSAVSAAGRDQYNQRLEHNRERFAEQTGELARTESKKRGWVQLLAFGDERYVRPFERGFADGGELRHAAEADLIAEPVAKIERRIEQILPDFNRDRERALIERIKEAAFAEGRSALGIQETLQALGEGRVEHLVYDAERDYPDPGLPSEEPAAPDGVPVLERMIELAISTGAAITPVEGESAAALADQGGVVALLRY